MAVALAEKDEEKETYKLVIVGTCAVGKTSICKKFTEDTFSDTPLTIGTFPRHCKK